MLQLHCISTVNYSKSVILQLVYDYKLKQRTPTKILFTSLSITVGTLAPSLSRIKDYGIQIIFPVGSIFFSLVITLQIFQWHLASFSTISLYAYSSLNNCCAFAREYKCVTQTK